MDLLVVHGTVDVPSRLVERALHVIETDEHGMAPELVAHVRAHIPRSVGVVGSTATAVALREAGFPVTLYTDEDVDAAAGELQGIAVVPLTDPASDMDAVPDVLHLVGRTPLVRLDRLARDVAPHVLAKLEYFNPGGSIKDRPAITMIEEAERSGALRPGGTIVEPTSGNTGVGLAIVAARKRYKCVFVVPDKVSQEKINLLRAYGAEVVVCPTTVAPEHPESYYSVSDRLAHEIPGAFKPNQYENPANPAAHVATTGPEIWEQTKGRVTHVVAGIGTAGTIVGIARFLKAQDPSVQIVGADPEGSVYSGGTGRPYLVEGVGEDFWPGNYDPTVIDRVIPVSDRDAFVTARRLTREEGVFAGGSSGMAVWAALELSKELPHDAVVVVIVPDSGRGYLSKVYSDAWMADYGFVHSGGPTVADVLAAKGSALPELVHVHPHESVREVVGIMREFGVSQVVMVSAEPPLVMGEVVGGVTEEDLLRETARDPAVLDQPIGDLAGAVPPTVGSGERVQVAVERLDRTGALLVTDGGHPIGIVTRSDVLGYLASGISATS